VSCHVDNCQTIMLCCVQERQALETRIAELEEQTQVYSYGFVSDFKFHISSMQTVLTFCKRKSTFLCGLRFVEEQAHLFFLAKCRKRRLNLGSFVWLCFALFAFLSCV